MKRVLAAILCAALCLGLVPSLTGCAQGGESAVDSIRIGVSVYYKHDTFIGEMMKHFTALARQMEQDEGISINIIRESAENKQSTQNDQVESFIESGCDVICVNLVDRADAAVIIDRAEASGVPVIFFNRELVEDDLNRSSKLYYVGAEARQSGTMQGRIVADLWDADPGALDRNGDGVLQYVMLEGEAGHQDAVVRTESAVKAVTDAGVPLERLEDEIANWKRSEAETKMTDWLDIHGSDIELVFANNDDMALGAVDALKRAGTPWEDWPAVVGIDGTPVGLESVLAGEMTGTVYNDGKGQAEGMLRLACALHFGGELPELQDGKYIRLPYQIVTPENVVEFISRGQ